MGTRRCARCGARLRDPLSFEELFEAPTTLQGRYAIEKRLKRGHATAVYLARDQGLSRLCVIKEFNPRRLSDDFERDEAQRSFHAEAVRWAQIRHPHLARIQDMFLQAGSSYLVMEWVRGRTLRHLVADPAAEVSEVNAVAWVAQICDALAVLHSQNPPLIFGDLNPSHVMVTSDGQVKLVDFGLSAWFMPWERGTPRYQGSPGYAAPEQRERWEADPRSDLYALGGLLYYLLTRQAPNQPPIRLNELPPTLAEIVRRARQRDPERRFPSAQAMREALTKAAPGLSVTPLQSPRDRSLAPTIVQQPLRDPWASLCAQLAGQAGADWLRAVRRFYGGQTIAWLQREAGRLTKEGATDVAERIEAAIMEAETLLARGEMEDALGRQVMVARWLTKIGAVPSTPGFTVSPQRLAFGELTRRVAKRTALRIRNTGPGVLVGEVVSELPWLDVRDERFTCGSGEEARVVVAALGNRLPLEEEGAVPALGPGTAGSQGGLRVITNRGEAWVSASASLVVPTLTISPTALNFGEVQRGQIAQAELLIANQGGGEIEGAVKSAVTWLSVSPQQFHVGAGGQQTVRVRFHSELAPAEIQEAANVLAVDSDYGQARLSARWHWAEPGLAISPTALLWGERERGAPAEMTMTIINSGTAMLEGRLLARCPWLSVTPEMITCPPGESLPVSVRAHLDDLPPGRTALGEALVIETNAGRRVIAASVDVLAPELQIKPISLELGEAGWGEVCSVTLRLANRGTMPLTARLESLFPWLRVEPAEVACPPGESARVSVEAHTEEMLHGGDWRAVPGVRIESNAGWREVPLSLVVYKPELRVTPEFLDFGAIPRQGVGQATLYISNPGTGPLTWSLSGDALWLEVTTPQGITSPGETSQVHLYAYGLAVPAEQDEVDVVLTVESDAGEQVVRGHVAIARPQLWVVPPLLDLGVSVNYAPAEGVLSLFNRGVGDLTGTVRVTVPPVPGHPGLSARTGRTGWLTAEPAEFRIPTGGQQPITVRAVPDGLREGETLVEGALEVSSNAGREQVDVRIEIHLSGQLEIEPPRLAWALGETPPALHLRNAGYAPLSVIVRPQAGWLRVNHDLLVIKPGRVVDVELALDGAALPSDPVAETEIVLDQGGQVSRVAVEVGRRGS